MQSLLGADDEEEDRNCHVKKVLRILSPVTWHLVEPEQGLVSVAANQGGRSGSKVFSLHLRKLQVRPGISCR
jgi:hypothetical protein